MDERKRPLAVDSDTTLPSRKRIIKDENGQQMRMDAEKEKENYQKDAILRQLKEYKRQRKDLEEQVNELARKTQYHDEHLRICDAWFAQLLDEVRVLAAGTLPTPPPSASSHIGEELYHTALLFENNESFSQHLQSRSSNIKRAISDLFGRMPSASLEAEQLRGHLNEYLAKEKVHTVELRRIMDERDSLSDRLEAASYRYMTAEKKLDRAKSSQVLKLEKAAMMSSAPDASSPTKSKKAGTPSVEHPETNGDSDNGTATAEAETARAEAEAVAAQRKAQLDEIESENERLTNELSAARTKVASLSDDDYAETSLCKTIKSSHEDAIKRINDLEATNIQLRQEAQKLHSERTTYRTAVDDENRNDRIETETQLARTENDLSRVRGLRDDLQAELSIRKAAEDNRRMAADQSKELAAARDSRISALESEVERLKLELGQSDPAGHDVEELDVDTLRSKLRTVESQYALLSNELPSLEAAWKKTQVIASKKVQEIADFEENIARLSAEKTKANQKFFDAMKAKDLQFNELKALKTQNARSSEIVTQLKDTEGKTRELVANLERQLAESREGLVVLETQHRTVEQSLKERDLLAEGTKKQLEQLRALIESKDRDNLAAAKAKRTTEEELEKAVARLEDAKKQLETTKQAKVVASSGDSDAWRKLAICPVCNTNLRNTVIKLCGHVFCKSCIGDLISNRSRKCPNCGRAFGGNDHMPITLT